MIFVILGIAILVVSFVIALASLLREQQTFKEKPKIVEEDEAAAKEDKLSSKKSEVEPEAKSHQMIHDEKSDLVDDRFPWEEPLKKSTPIEEQTSGIIEKEEEAGDFGPKLEGKFSMDGLVRKREDQKESASK
jgi:hypothetical protein